MSIGGNWEYICIPWSCHRRRWTLHWILNLGYRVSWLCQSRRLLRTAFTAAPYSRVVGSRSSPPPTSSILNSFSYVIHRVFCSALLKSTKLWRGIIVFDFHLVLAFASFYCLIAQEMNLRSRLVKFFHKFVPLSPDTKKICNRNNVSKMNEMNFKCVPNARCGVELMFFL